MSKGRLIPELRFPEFLTDGNWEERFIEEFFSVGSSKRVLQEDWTNNGVPFYRTRELVSLSKNEPFGSEIFISEKLFLEISEKYGIPSVGDFLVSGVGTLGICYQVKSGDKFYFKDGNVLWFKLKRGIDSTYFKFCFESDYIQKQIVKQTSISTVGTFTIQNAKKTKLWYPPVAHEQQKIASCFSSLDEVITAHSQKLELLKNHKKGLMQNLFPQEGETVPKYRFKEFENNGEWGVKIFDDILDITRLAGYEYSEYWKEDDKKEIIALRGYNIGKGTLLLHNLGYISNELSLQLNRSKLYKGDIVYPCVGTIGNAVVIEEDNKFHIQQNIAKLTPKKDVSPYFISQFLMSPLGLIEVNKFNATSSQPNVLVGSLRNFKISIPRIGEQQKIASCLSSLDALITAQEDKIEQLKLHKKGLMQGLFPKIID